MDEEWYLIKLKELKEKENKTEILNEVKSRLETTPISFAVTSALLNESQIFDCLYEKSGEHTQLALDTLAFCLSTLDINRDDFGKNVINSLKHQNYKLRSLALHEIYKNLIKSAKPDLTDEAATNRNELDHELTLLVMERVEDPETEVAGPAIKILSEVLQTQLDNPQIRSAFSSMLKNENLIRIRVYEIAVNLAKTNSVLLEKVQDILDKMLTELDSKDILFQFNLLELLVSLAEQNHGFEFIEDRKIFDKVALRVESDIRTQDLMTELIVPGFMKFFGKIGFHQPRKIVEGYPSMISYLFSSFNHVDVDILPVALDTLGNLAHSSEGKIVLDEKFPNLIMDTFKQYTLLLRNLPSAMKCRTFASLEMIFTYEGIQNNRIDSITKKWCNALLESEYDLSELGQYFENPFPDIKMACLSFIKAICSYQWGIDAFMNTAGFYEMLINRNMEFDKNVKHIKYEIISILADSDRIDPTTLLQLKRYVAEGPYFVEPLLEVSVD